jgi:hypothetical protein
MDDQQERNELVKKLSDLEVRIVRLEVGTEERHKAYTDKHDQLIKQMSVVTDDIKWFGKLSISGFCSLFLAILGATITIAFKKGII